MLALVAVVPLGFAAETQSVTPAPAIRMAPAAAGLPPLPAVVREESLEQQEARLKWFREARFGLFIHWGVYPAPLPWGRTTQKARPGGGTTLYIHVWEWPADGRIVLSGIKQSARSGRLLPNGAAVTSSATEAGLVVTLPGAAPDPDVSVAALEFDRPLEVAGAAPLPTETGASGTLADPSKSPPAK